MFYTPEKPVRIVSVGAVVGKKERCGPLAETFAPFFGSMGDPDGEDRFGQKTFEKAEAEMQRRAVRQALERAGCTELDISLLFAGDLVNQCIASHYGLLSFGIPHIGLFGACSTAAEGLLLATMTLGGGRCGARAVNVTSSHYCTAERQFRFPLEYGGQRTPSAQWTVTAAAAFVTSIDAADIPAADAYVPEIRAVMPGRMVDGGIRDAGNMGAAMAPAALDTILRYHAADPAGFQSLDMICTGDLGREGSAILCDLAYTKGVPIDRLHADCGKMIYANDDTHSGGSGCGCSGAVWACDILENVRRGILNSVLLVGTGALMNTMAVCQGQTIPGIAHAVHVVGHSAKER